VEQAGEQRAQAGHRHPKAREGRDPATPAGVLQGLGEAGPGRDPGQAGQDHADIEDRRIGRGRAAQFADELGAGREAGKHVLGHQDVGHHDRRNDQADPQQVSNAYHSSRLRLVQGVQIAPGGGWVKAFAVSYAPFGFADG
jgi:hypothetical protein